MATNTSLLAQAAIGVILLSIQTTLAPTAVAQSASRTQTVETIRVDNQNLGRQQPAASGTFAAPGDVSTIQCESLSGSIFLCGCGTTNGAECSDTLRAKCDHVEPGQALCDEDISDE